LHLELEFSLNQSDSHQSSIDFTFPFPESITTQLNSTFTLNQPQSFNESSLSQESDFILPLWTAKPNYFDQQNIDFGLNQIEYSSQKSPVNINLPSISYTSRNLANINKGASNLAYDSSNDSLSIYTKNQTHGLFLEFPSLPHNYGYIIAVKSQYLSGLPLRLSFKNAVTQFNLFEDELSRQTTPSWDYFLIPPSDDGYGFQLELNAVSYAGILSLSQVHRLALIPIPYQYLSHINTGKPIPASSTISPVFESKFNHTFFSITLPPSLPASSYLTLPQSFSKGWLAFYFGGLRPVFLRNHILVNNWANGWEIQNIRTDGSQPIPPIFILFWPQLLEFIGLSIIPFIFFLILKNFSDSR